MNSNIENINFKLSYLSVDHNIFEFIFFDNSFSINGKFKLIINVIIRLYTRIGNHNMNHYKI